MRCQKVFCACMTTRCGSQEIAGVVMAVMVRWVGKSSFSHWSEQTLYFVIANDMASWRYILCQAKVGSFLMSIWAIVLLWQAVSGYHQYKMMMMRYFLTAHCLFW